MVGTVDLAAIVAAAAESGSKIVMVGDPKQLPAIDAGGMFRLLTERHDTAELDTGWRFAEPWEFDNSRLLSQGDHTALDTLNDHGRVHAAADWPDTVANVVEHHRHALRSDQTFIATAHTRSEVHTLNMALRQNLDLGPELLTLPRTDLNVDTPIATSDIIITGRNDPNLTDDHGGTVNNGARWRVLGLRRGHLHVERLDAPGVTALLPEDYVLGANPDGRPWIEHSIAVTTYRAQGATVDHSVAVAAAGANRAQLYVQATRGRLANHLVVAGAGDRSQAVAVLHTALDQLPDDVTGIEHSETHPAQAAQPVQSEPSSRPPSGPPTEKQPTLDEVNEFMAVARDNFPHFDRDFELATRAAEFKTSELESWPRLWKEMTRLHRIHQPPPQPEPPPPPPPKPPPLPPRDFDIGF